MGAPSRKTQKPVTYCLVVGQLAQSISQYLSTTASYMMAIKCLSPVLALSNAEHGELYLGGFSLDAA
jgi:hypothetical protein